MLFRCMLTSELHYADQSSKQEWERIKYALKSGAMVYDKFAHVPPISVGVTNISRSEAISFHKAA